MTVPAKTLNTASFPNHLNNTTADFDSHSHFLSDSDPESESVESNPPVLDRRSRQHLYIQDVAYRSQPRWKRLLYSMLPHAPWWKTSASPLDDGPCSSCQRAMSVPRRKPRNWLGCGLGTLLVLYATDLHTPWSIVHADLV